MKGVYSDFLLYTLDDPGVANSYAPVPPKLLAERLEHLPKPEEWKTPPLWGVASSAPYFHDGSAPTLESAIQRHRGDAKMVSAKYLELKPEEQAAVIAFLKSLKAPPHASALSNPEVVRLRK